MDDELSLCSVCLFVSKKSVFVDFEALKMRRKTMFPQKNTISAAHVHILKH